MISWRTLTGALIVFVVGVGPAAAEPVNIQAVLKPKEQIRLAFEDDSEKVVLLVRREGTSIGTGLLAGLKATEYGIYDLLPGVGGDPRGYLEMAAQDGDVAYIKWHLRVVFVAEADGEPILLDNGYWELVGGTGRFKGLKGAGVLHITSISEDDRRFMLTGDIVAAPRQNGKG